MWSWRYHDVKAASAAAAFVCDHFNWFFASESHRSATKPLMDATTAPGVYHMTSSAAAAAANVDATEWPVVLRHTTPADVISPVVISFVNDRRSHFTFYSFNCRDEIHTRMPSSCPSLLVFRQSNFSPVYRDCTLQRRCINSYRRATHGRSAW